MVWTKFFLVCAFLLILHIGTKVYGSQDEKDEAMKCATDNRCADRGCTKVGETDTCTCKVGEVADEILGCKEATKCAADNKCGHRGCSKVGENDKCTCKVGEVTDESLGCKAVTACDKSNTCGVRGCSNIGGKDTCICKEGQIEDEEIGCKDVLTSTETTITDGTASTVETTTEKQSCSAEMKVRCGKRGCKNNGTSESCICENKEIQDDTKKCTEIRPCSSAKEAECLLQGCHLNSKDKPNCRCPPKFILNDDFECVDMQVDCAVPHPNENTVVCECRGGFKPANSSSSITTTGCVDVCENHKCEEGHCKAMNESGNEYECKCNDGYYGKYCEEKETKASNKAAVAVGVVLTLLLVIVFTWAAVVTYRLRKKSEIPNSPTSALSMSYNRMS